MGGNMAGGKKVAVRLMVDRERKRVAFAEAGADFVDILLSFLTMPIGTVIRLIGLNKSPSSLGSFVNIYQSAANLDTSCFCTEACKAMLLRPQNPEEARCEDLDVNIDEPQTRSMYTCKDCVYAKYFYSSVPDSRCRCGQVRSQLNKLERTDVKAHQEGVFANGVMRYVITDDLNVSPASPAFLMRTFKALEIKDAGKLEERNLELGRDEITNLLLRTLISATPLTDLCFNAPEKDEVGGQRTDGMIQPKHEDSNSRKIKLKLVVDKESNRLLFAEAGEEMVDLLFSWLAFPLGLVAKHARGMPQGCIGNLRKSLECHSLAKCEFLKSMLLSPKLAPFHGCSSQLLNAEEMASTTRCIPGCSVTKKAFNGYEYTALAEFKQVNPRSTSNETSLGGGYVRGYRKYIVTDDLRVFPFSLPTLFQVLGKLKVPADGTVEREVSLGATLAADLLRASSVSRTALSDVFPLVK